MRCRYHPKDEAMIIGRACQRGLCWDCAEEKPILLSRRQRMLLPPRLQAERRPKDHVCRRSCEDDQLMQRDHRRERGLAKAGCLFFTRTTALVVAILVFAFSQYPSPS